MSPLEGSLEYGDRSLVYDALANERRRRAVRLLNEADRPLSLRELADGVARRELSDATGSAADAEGESVPDAAIRRVRTSLYHVHVPKLSDAGIVRYTRDEERIELTGSVSFDEIDVLSE